MPDLTDAAPAEAAIAPPQRCPPSPYERACLIAQRMKEKGTKGKIIVVDANKGPMPPPLAKPMLTAMNLKVLLKQGFILSNLIIMNSSV